MAREELQKYADELAQEYFPDERNIWARARFRKDGWAWFKSFGKSKFEEGRSNYQVCFDVIDFSLYADREPRFKVRPYGIEPLVLISRTVDERVDLHLSHTKVDSNNITEIERLAESFFKWVENEVEV